MRRAVTARYMVLFLIMSLLLVIGGVHSVAAKDRVEIKFWYAHDPDRWEVYKGLIDRFNESQNDIKVIGTRVEGGTLGIPKVLSAIAGGTAPDLVYINGMQCAAGKYRDCWEPLTPFFKAEGVDPMKKYTPCQMITYIYNGEIYGVPVESMPCSILFWNKKHFREVGLDPNRAPRDIPELERYDRALRIVEGGKVKRAGFIPWDLTGWVYQYWFYEAGSPLYDEKKHTYIFNDDISVKSLEWVVSYTKVYSPSQFQGGFKEQAQESYFVSGKESMVKAGMWFPNAYLNPWAPKDFEWGVGMAPQPTNIKRHDNYMGGEAFAIPKGSKNREAAWKLLKWLQGDEATAIWAKKLSQVPAVVSQIGNPKFYEGDVQKWAHESVLKYSNWTVPGIPLDGFVFNAYVEAGDEAVFGKKTPKQALTDAQAAYDLEAQKYISDYGKWW